MRFPFGVLVLGLLAVACDPVSGSGNGSPQPPQKALFVNTADRTAVLTLQAGYPSGKYQFNFNGYQYGALMLAVPAGWTLQVECVNRGTVDNSCAVTRAAGERAPADSAWTTPVLKPGQSASFTMTDVQGGTYRITDLVPAREAAGAWMRLTVDQRGSPSISASGS